MGMVLLRFTEKRGVKMARPVPRKTDRKQVEEIKTEKTTSSSSTSANNYKHLSLTDLRSEYGKLLKEKNRLQDSCTCHVCGKMQPKETQFYKSSKYGSGVHPVCKECLYRIATDYNETTKQTHETEATLRKALRMGDFPFVASIYKNVLEYRENDTNTWKTDSVWKQYMGALAAYPQYKDKGWEDSDFEILEQTESECAEEHKAALKTKKFFGVDLNLTDQAYIFLQEQYNDWTSRYECKTKAQEEIFKRICFKQLEILNATKHGDNTKDLDATFQQLMASANITPKQNSLDAFSNAQTFGTLIQKFEEEDPIPEPDPEVSDVDGFGLYIDTFYRGHIAKLFKLKNAFSGLYDKLMSKYTVKKPHYDEDSDEEALFDQVFGGDLSDDTTDNSSNSNSTES